MIKQGYDLTHSEIWSQWSLLEGVKDVISISKLPRWPDIQLTSSACCSRPWIFLGTFFKCSNFYNCTIEVKCPPIFQCKDKDTVKNSWKKKKVFLTVKMIQFLDGLLWKLFDNWHSPNLCEQIVWNLNIFHRSHLSDERKTQNLSFLNLGQDCWMHRNFISDWIKVRKFHYNY